MILAAKIPRGTAGEKFGVRGPKDMQHESSDDPYESVIEPVVTSPARSTIWTFFCPSSSVALSTSSFGEFDPPYFRGARCIRTPESPICERI